MSSKNEYIEVFEAVLFALVCPFAFLMNDTREKEDKEEIKGRNDNNNQER